MMVVSMRMSMGMRMGRRIEMNLWRRPVQNTLQPAAEESNSCQHADVAQLPPEIGQAHEAQTFARTRVDARPDQCRKDDEQDGGSPGAGGQYMTCFFRIDAAQPPRCPDDPQQ